ncbi:flagellar hook-associated protein 1 FlgK [Natronospira proteinivora]|uniref:Flagellar hook-associated protein 1 n=1 Tax=Natronospira proteinivora TaxID=1807133 RepID=A0ABT1G7T2_9GAMM|nr:flagellar hook-associated protein FlgK [Natronospira proteinivora]MCP1726423.1 flagellar hook-associated protein 1 FlgK [Natronospira proteinivora]
MSLLNNSVSGLLAAQRQLTTTGHNINNVNTEGYSRQRVDQSTRPPMGFGDGFVGQGTQVSGINRLYDQFLGDQLQNATSAHAELESFTNLAQRVDNLLADADAGLTPSLQNFFNAVQDVADDPSSISARQVLLSEAEALVNRFDTIDQRMSDLESEINSEIRNSVEEINGLTDSIARLNQQIGDAVGQGRGQPNDLLDQRDQKLQELSELIKIEKVSQDDGSVNVFVGNGTNLVIGNEPYQLEARRNDFDPSRLEVARAGQPEPGNLSTTLEGGSLGGIMGFREDVLDPTLNQLGKIAHGLTESFNEVHAEGIDLRGEFGEAFFSVPDPQARPRRGNEGDAEIQATVSSAQELSGGDYRLRFVGGDWQINRADTGEEVDFDGDGSPGDPFTFDGLEVVVDGTPEDGDAFEIQPTRAAGGGLERVIDDPRSVAAAAPIIGGADGDNLGSGTITLGEVVDVDDPDLMETVEIEFLDEDTFEINGDTFTYEAGEPIEYNGWQVSISGQPEAGDTFTVQANSGGSGDNRNANRLADLVDEGVMDGGQTSLQDGVGELVADVATKTSQAQTNRDAQSTLKSQARESLESVSGVNLDEEAANLMKFQQAYQASAQSIRVADTIFQSLINAVGR